MSKETPENVPISSALQFKQAREAREAGEILTLASGLTVRLKRPDVTKIIAKGLIPSQMVQRVMTMQNSDGKTINAEDMEAMLTFQREIAKYALISPLVSEEPNYENNEIHIDDLDATDLEEVWTYANGGLASVEMFRKNRQAGLLSGPNSDKVSEQTT